MADKVKMQNKIKEGYFRELEPYSLEKIAEILNISDKKIALNLVKELKEYGILKHISKNNLNESDEYCDVLSVKENDEKNCFRFCFVGVIVAKGYVIQCYPKYIHKNNDYHKIMQTIVRVIEAYNRKKDRYVVALNSEYEEEFFNNRIGLILFLLQDYYDFGIYKNSSELIENNGHGKILWNKTINSTFPLIKNNKPYYMELKTRRTINDENDYFTRLHQFVLDSASTELDNLNLFSVFNNFSPVYFDDNKIEDFGGLNTASIKIKKELSTQYNTRKQLLLKAMLAYLENISTKNKSNAVYAYGTTVFHVIWESVCKDVFHDKLNKKACIAPFIDEKGGHTYKELIEKPLWKYNNNKVYADDTLLPDLIMIKENKFVILDAKYYDVSFGKSKIQKQPGIESVVKQYAYYLAYRNKFGIKLSNENSANCFIMPAELNNEEGYVIKKSNLSFVIFNDCPEINVILVEPEKLYNIYLGKDNVDLSSKILSLLN